MQARRQLSRFHRLATQRRCFDLATNIGDMELVEAAVARCATRFSRPATASAIVVTVEAAKRRGGGRLMLPLVARGTVKGRTPRL